jgi:CheY-like chemotaxis protein
MARILVVDDEQPILSIVAEVIGQMGHEVLCAINGREALVLIRATRPDLVLSDVMMPFMNGLELCRELKADAGTSHIVVILMSAVPPDRAQHGGCDGFVHKPFSLDEIEAAVDSGLRQERAGSTA